MMGCYAASRAEATCAAMVLLRISMIARLFVIFDAMFPLAIIRRRRERERERENERYMWRGSERYMTSESYM
jgi:hypothetical protein